MSDTEKGGWSSFAAPGSVPLIEDDIYGDFNTPAERYPPRRSIRTAT